MPILLNKTIRLFLDSIGRREEYEFYLNKFQTGQEAAFAILCPDRAGFEDTAPVVTFDIDFLLKLGLAPVILLCGPDAGAMRELLLTGYHPFIAHDLPGSGPALDTATDVAQRVTAAHRHGQAVVLTAAAGEPAAWLRALAPAIARRVHFLRLRGPLQTPTGEFLFYYYTAPTRQVPLAEEDQPLAQLAADLLEARPGLHISVAAPYNLLKELFTIKGAGSIVRRGSVILRLTDPGQVDRPRLVRLLEDSFGKRLRDPGCLDHVAEIYVQEQYHGAALLERHPAGLYLSKFAVGTEARGEGLAQELWRDMVRDHAAIFWRARRTNPFNSWYEKQADGTHQAGAWRVFWRGIRVEDIQAVIAYSLARPEDFVAAAPGALA